MEVKQHKEAFCLMWYACESCPHVERIWNSRNGVTPFGCGCPSCGGTMLHTEWYKDDPQPNYKPRSGQAFWRDGTMDEAEKIIRARLARMRAPPNNLDCSPEREEEMVKAMRAGDPEWNEFQPGWPTLERVP